MEIINTLKEKLSETAVNVVKKSNTVVETTKIKFAIMDSETEIAKLLKEIGGIVYETYKSGVVFDGELNEKCIELDRLYSQIAEYKEKINSLRDIKVCKSCEKEIDAKASYCPFCGAKAEEEK